MELPGGTSLSVRRHMADQLVFSIFYKGPGSDEHPPGDTSSMARFCDLVGFWVDFDRGMRELIQLFGCWMLKLLN